MSASNGNNRDVGYVYLGSVSQRWLTCGTPSCACHSDPKRRHAIVKKIQDVSFAAFEAAKIRAKA